MLKNSYICLVADNLRSALNIGSLFRLADGLGISHFYICGLSPYPPLANDQRLAHVIKNAQSKIHKTALGAEQTVNWSYYRHTSHCLNELKSQGLSIIALEQTKTAVDLNDFQPKSNQLALIVGNELSGISSEVLKLADNSIQIKMQGQKESLNVSTAAAIALYNLQLQLG